MKRTNCLTARRGAALGAAVILAFGLTAARAVASGCPDGLSDRLVVEVLFGRNIGQRIGVSEAQFRRFLDTEVTPRFPNGFTLFDTYGQYRSSPERPLVREPGKLLLIALDDETSDLPKVRALIDAYKVRFRQQSVGLFTRRTCVSF